MKRWIHAAKDDAGLQSAKRMMADRMDYLREREDPIYQQLEKMLDDEEEDYANSDQSVKFKPSKELYRLAKENGFELKHGYSKYIPDYRQWFVQKKKEVNASNLLRFEFIVKRYDNDSPEVEVVCAESQREAEDQLNNDEYVEWWDYNKR